MTKLNDKSKKLDDLLNAPWVSFDQVDEGVKITGMTKSDYITIDASELDLVKKQLQSKENKRVYGAIKILGYFGLKAKPFLKDISKNIFEFNEQEQNEILQSMKRIDSKEFLVEMGEIIDKNPSYDLLFDIVFYISELLKEYPIEGLLTILKCSSNKEMWIVLKNNFETGLNKLEKPFDPKAELLSRIELETPIGISQEMERKRIQYNITKDNIYKALRKIQDLTIDANKTISISAKKALKTIKSKIKK
ncbi:MAG TPA: hypothetical protein VMZ29_17010 [Candidatus Bathyarchaeia archaeon]|nr:hypothetical protein [Candidatus Bathyarchaeia archaeon]